MTHRHMLWQTFAAHKWRRKEPLSQDNRQPQQVCLERSTRDTCTGKFQPRQRVTSAATHSTRALGKPSKRLKQLRRLIYPRGPNYPVTITQDHDSCQLKTHYTHTHPFNDPFSRTTRVSRYQKGKTNLDFTVARDSKWQWHQLGHMQVCTSLQTDNHASNPPLSFFTGWMPFLLPNQQHQSTEGMSAVS